MATEQGIIDDIRDTIENGAILSSVDSTEDRLVLVLGNGKARNRYLLDVNATRTLVEADLIDRLAGATPDRPEPLARS